MIVRARANTGSALSAAFIDRRMGYHEDTEFALTLGREYQVYAVTTVLGGAWFYVLNDDKQPWPIHSPAILFDVVDHRMPAGWVFGYHRFTENENLLLSWPEWADDHWFYERLVQGNTAERQVFRAWVGELEPDNLRQVY